MPTMPISLPNIALVATSALLFALLPTARGHGAMTEAAARGTLMTYSLTLPDRGIPGLPKDDCPHCLNGGGKGAVMEAANNKWRPWEPLNNNVPFREDAGLCGDPIKMPAPRDHEKGGKFGPPKALPYVKVYKEGETVRFVADITTNHNGFFEFFICDVGNCGGDISKECFKKGHCHQLQRATVPECENSSSMECGPIDPAYPGRWYVPCRKGGHVGEHFMGGRFMQYKLPAGFVCKDCVIQWYWATANSCNPPGFKEYFDKYPMKKWGRCPGDGGAFGGRNPVLATCGGPTFPEEFWMCADVRVTGKGVAPPSKEPKDVETRKFVPENALTTKNGRTPIVITTEKTPPAKPTPSPTPRPKPVNAADTAKDCMPKKQLEFRDPNETTPDPTDAKCASNWKQCGGLFYEGPTSCCTSRFECVAVNKYYAQCKAPARSGPQRARM